MTLYLSLKEAIKENIIKNLDVNSKLPRELDIQKMFNVSRGTVRAALKELVNEKIIKRYRKRGTFVEKISDGFLNIGFVFSGYLHFNSVYFYIYEILKDELEKQKFKIFYYEDIKDEISRIDEIMIRKLLRTTSGLFLVGDIEYKFAEILTNTKIQLVAIDHEFKGLNIDTVKIDNYMVVKRLSQNYDAEIKK